jgi:hypothetical protein
MPTKTRTHKLQLDIALLYKKNPTAEGLEEALDFVRDAWYKEESILQQEAEAKAYNEEKLAAAQKLYNNMVTFYEMYYPNDKVNMTFDEFYEALEA